MLHGDNMQLFVGPNRSFASKRVGRHLAQVAAVLRELHPSKELTVEESAGPVCFEWSELVPCVFVRGVHARSQAHCSCAAMEPAGLDFDASLVLYRDATGRRTVGHQV